MECPGKITIVSSTLSAAKCETYHPPEPHLHQVKGVRRTTNEEDLHDGVVQADIRAGQKVDITRKEDGEV